MNVDIHCVSGMGPRTILLNFCANYCAFIYFSSQLQYRNPWGNVRMGRLLEDLDSLAGNVAYAHWCALRPEPCSESRLVIALRCIEGASHCVCILSWAAFSLDLTRWCELRDCSEFES